MKKAVTLALCTMAVSQAHAQEFTGATLRAERLTQTIEGWSGSGETDALGADVEFRIGAFVIQGGVTQNTSYWDMDVSNVELHLGYQLTDALTVAVFGVSEDWDGDIYKGIGAELAYDYDRWSGEVWFKHESSDDDTGYAADVFATSLAYDLTDRFSVMGRVVTNRFEGDSDSELFARLGGSFRITDGLSTDLYVEKVRYGSEWMDELNNVGFALRYDFGDGVTFGSRHYMDYYHSGPGPI